MFGEKFVMTRFHRELYRFHMEEERRSAAGRADTVTTISLDKDDPSKKTEHVAVLNGTLPPELSDITRILRVDDIRNDGEGETHSGRHYPERQILRIFAELEDGGRGVMAMTLDRLYGTMRWDFGYERWGASQVGGGVSPLAELHQPWRHPYVLALYRLCELLDADPEKGGHGFYRHFIAEALSRPEGFGFPKFASDEGRYLLGIDRATPPAAKSGRAENVVREAWYVHGHKGFDRLDDARYFWIGKAEVHPLDRRAFWLDDAVKVTCENGGFGRITPEYQYYIGDIWLKEGDTLARIDGGAAAMILQHVVQPPSDTGAIMRALQKGA